MLTPSPQMTLTPQQVNSFPGHGQALQQGGPPQTGQWGGLGSVTYEPNAQNQMQPHSFPGQQGPGHRAMSEWTMRPAEQQIGLASQAASERNQALRDNIETKQQLLGAYTAVRQRIEPSQKEITRLQDELSRKPAFSKDALSSCFERMQACATQMQDYSQLMSDNVTQVQLLEESNAIAGKATVKLNENAAQITSLLAQVESLKGDKQGLEGILKGFQTALSETQGRCEAFQTALATQAASNRKLQLEASTHQEVLAKNQDKIEGLEASLTQGTETLQQLQTKVSSLTSQLARLEHQCIEKDTEIQRMSDRIEKLQVRGDDYKTRVEQDQKVVATLVEKQKDLQSELAQIRDDLQSARNQLQEAEQAHAMSVQQLKQSHQGQVTDLQTAISKNSELLEQTRTEKSQLEGQLTKLLDGTDQEVAKELRLKLAAKDETVRGLENNIIRLESDLGRRETDYEQALSELKNSKQEVAYLTGSLRSTREELGVKEQTMRMDAETMDQQSDQIARLNEMNNQILEQIESQKAQTNHQIGEFQRQLDIVRGQSEVNTNKVNDFGAKLTNCLSRLEEALKDHQSLATALEELRVLNTEFHREGGVKHSNGDVLRKLDSLDSQVSAFLEASDNAVTPEHYSQERSEPFSQDRLQHSQQTIQSVTMTRDRAGSLESLSPVARHTSSQSEAPETDLDTMVRDLDASGPSSGQGLGFGQRPTNLSMEIRDVLRSTSPNQSMEDSQPGLEPAHSLMEKET